MMFLCNTNHHTNAVLTDNVPLSYHNGHVVDGELDQEIVTGNQSVEENRINIDNCCNASLCTIDINTKGLTAKKTIQNGYIPNVNADTSLVASSNSNSNLDLKENILESAVTDDETSQPVNIVNGNNHQTSIPQSKFHIVLTSRKFSVEKTVPRSVSSASIGVVNVLYYKILTIITMCCSSGFLLLLIILYYAMQTGIDIPIDTEYSQGKNTSNVIVCFKLRIDTHRYTHS